MDNLRFQDFAFDVTPAHFQGQHRPIEAIRLIVVDAVAGAISHDWMSNIGTYFTSNDTLVWNDALLTNLHNPKGTHAIMACALGGRELVWRLAARLRSGDIGLALMVTRC